MLRFSLLLRRDLSSYVNGERRPSAIKLILTIFIFVGCVAQNRIVRAQTWTALTHQPSFSADTPLLLTDGTVMVHKVETNNWWKLTPDSTGSYVNGTWTQLGSMQSNYGPLYFASAVLPDGKVVVEGGEYNPPGGSGFTNYGAIYDPAANVWTAITAPSGWSKIGDAQSVVLPNGTFMLGGGAYNSASALLNESSLTWTTTGSGKADNYDEEGFNLLASGNVLTVDAADTPNYEIYTPSTGAWTSKGSVGVVLADTCEEVGPAVLRPDGTMFATGGPSATAIYHSSSGTWTAGPSFPSGKGVSDGPAAILPDGNVLVSASPTCVNETWGNGTQFYEFNGTSLTAVPNPPNAANQAAYIGNMLVLPSLQVLYTNQSSAIEIYTPAGTYQSAWQPTISNVATTLTVGSTNNSITGTQFNGLTQGGAYGDDNQSASNYPLVRLVNNSTGSVYYAKTHNHSTMAVATGPTSVSTEFDVPSNMPTGIAQLYVVANGIPSAAVAVTIASSEGYRGSESGTAPAQCVQYVGSFGVNATQTAPNGLNWKITGLDGATVIDIDYTIKDSSGTIGTGAISGDSGTIATTRLPVSAPTVSGSLITTYNLPAGGYGRCGVPYSFATTE